MRWVVLAILLGVGLAGCLDTEPQSPGARAPVDEGSASPEEPTSPGEAPPEEPPNEPPMEEEPPQEPPAEEPEPIVDEPVPDLERPASIFDQISLGQPCPPETWGPGELEARKYRCITPADFTRDGRELGFGDGYDINMIRPGINVEGCTSDFLFTDDEGALFLGLAQHCIEPGSGDECQAEVEDIGAAVSVEDYGDVATVEMSTYHAFQGHPPEWSIYCGSLDFALVRLDPSVHQFVHPAVRHIGGPVGLQDPTVLPEGAPVIKYGNSDDRGFASEFVLGQDHGTHPVSSRLNKFEGTFDSISNDGEVQVLYPYPPITGDSGSPSLTADGLALGALSRLSPLGPAFGYGHLETPIYDSLLAYYLLTGNVYYLVTWDEWSPDTWDN